MGHAASALMGRPVLARGVLAAGVLALLAGCAAPRQPMYLWERFPRQQYDTLLRSGASIDEQIRDLQAHAEKARGSAAALPPGFRAHLGMLYLSMGNADQARALWQAEVAAFPESAPYMERLMARLGPPADSKAPEPTK
jgi:hypothetical protein